MQKTVKDSVVILILTVLLFAALGTLVVRARLTFDSPHPDLFAVAFVSPSGPSFDVMVPGLQGSVDLTYDVIDEKGQTLAKGGAAVSASAPSFDPLASVADPAALHGRLTIRITGPGSVPRELSKVLP